MTNPRRSIFVGMFAIHLMFVAVTVAAYFPIFFNGFVGLDDPATVFENFKLTHLSATSFYSFWTESTAQLYTPLTYSLFAAISMVARIKGHPGAVPFYAWPFHAVSLVLHVLTVIVVYHLLRRLVGRTWPCIAGALLFAIHPVQVETVAWVSATNGLLCGLLSLLAVLIYLDASGDVKNGLNWSRWALATEVFVLSLLAKPLAVIVPGLALILFWLAKNRGSAACRRPWELLIWMMLAIPFAIVARLSQPVPDWWITVPIWQRPLVAADALAFYIWKLVWPLTLTADHNRSPGVIFANRSAYFSWIVPFIALINLIWLYRKRNAKTAVAGAMWFVCALIPVLGFTPFALQRLSTVADRYLYLPMFGIALIVASALSHLEKKNESSPDAAARSFRILMAAPCAILIGVLGARTWSQTHYWHDKQSLFEHSQEIIGREPGTRQRS